jgi:hypothetical protein
MDQGTFEALQCNLNTLASVVQATQQILSGTGLTEVGISGPPGATGPTGVTGPQCDIGGAVQQDGDATVAEIEARVDDRSIMPGNRSVHFGINDYEGCPLTGCIPDARNWAKFCTSQLGVPVQNARIVLDSKAKREGMWDQLQWAKKDLKAGDNLIITYSGHGAQDAGPGSDSEPDRLNEVWCCHDFAWTPETEISDKDLYQYVKDLPAGVKCFIVSDSCHSGDFFTRELTRNPHKITPRLYPIVPAHVRARLNKARQNIYRGMKFGLPDVVYLSGCRADQTSADTQDPNGNPCGALTYYALKNLYENWNRKYMTDLTNDIVDDLHSAGYSQTPQCEGARRKYILFGWTD